MPFDSVFKPFDRNATVENLRKAKGMIQDQGCWCQGVWSMVNHHGALAAPTVSRMSCAADAVHCAVYGFDWNQAIAGLSSRQSEARLKLFSLRPEIQALARSTSTFTARPYSKMMHKSAMAVCVVTLFNDHETHADVMELFDRAITYAREAHHAV